MDELVVAHYTEDLNWLWSLKTLPLKITVYNKSSGENLLLNIGREAHTYLWHIVERWDSLAPKTFFVQGNPLDHNKGFIKKMPHWLESEAPFLPLVKQPLFSDRTGGPHHHNLNPYRLWERIFNTPCPNQLVFFPGAMFMATASVIKRRPKEFYANLLEFADFPKFAWQIERLWMYIFCDDPYTYIEEFLSN